MRAKDLLLLELKTAHENMEKTIDGVSDEQANTPAPGKANPLGASYAHVVASEDMIVNMAVRHKPMISTTSRKGKTGLSEQMPTNGEDWADSYPKWTKNVKVELEALREYAKDVYHDTEEYFASLSDEDLDSEVDMGPMGKQTLAFVLAAFVVGHINNLMGEVAVLKGIQGLRGYPF